MAIGDEPPVGRLGLGTLPLTGPDVWGPPADPRAAVALLRHAVDQGVRVLWLRRRYV